MKFEVHEAVWLATAIMTLEVYEKNPNYTVQNISFKQVDIQKRAQFYTDKNVDHARVNQWNNADHPNNNYNYLRAVNKNRRITYIGEFNGVKEHPNLKLDEMIPFEKNPNRTITFNELLKFIGGEYKKIFSIQFEKIIDHLLRYANESYTDPSKTVGEQKQRLLAIRQSGSAAATEMDKLADYFAEKYGLINKGKSRWLEGNYIIVREYLWNQLKNKNKMDSPSSVSIFAKHPDSMQNIRFSVEIELDEKNASDEQSKLHNQLIRKEFMRDEHFCYHVKLKNGLDSYRTDLAQQELIEKVEDGEIDKVKLVYEIFSSEIEERQISNEQLLSMLDAAFLYFKKFYDEIVRIEEIVLPEGDEQMDEEVIKALFEKNIILYGPPGTGKTYHTALYAVAIIENVSIEALSKEPYEAILTRYNQYQNEGQIAFTTFHQSYGYEEFIEGIKPVLENEGQGEIQYKIEAGVFKMFCENAQKLSLSTNESPIFKNQRLWKVSIGGSGSNWLKEECFEENEIRIGWKEEGQNLEEYSNVSLYNFYEEMSVGDIVFSLGDQKHIDAIGIIKSDPVWLEGKENYPRARKVEWIAKNIRENIYDMNGHKNLTLQTIYELSRISIAKANELILKYANKSHTPIRKNDQKYVFIIDEINRGNISKILGELITLIEPSKRLGAPEQLMATLPYSKKEFGVPENVYIIGTMNTADRSIALLDTALRRRFQFTEMLPQPSVLSGLYIEDIDIQRLLQTINNRIEVLFDREHTIGHAYFIKLKNEPTLQALANVFENAIIPLLQEYFYEDYGKIQLVLGDNGKEDAYKFILDQKINLDMFRGNPDIYLADKRYGIQKSAFLHVESYKGIYE